MHEIPDLADTTSIEVFVQIPGAQTEKILAACLYTIDDPDEIRGIVTRMNPDRLSWATQRKAQNWLIFKFPDGTSLKADLDEEAGELRLTTNDWTREYKITQEASGQLSRHIEKARPLYERAHGV